VLPGSEVEVRELLRTLIPLCLIRREIPVFIRVFSVNRNGCRLLLAGAESTILDVLCPIEKIWVVDREFTGVRDVRVRGLGVPDC
jgi:hypothetical protein